MKIQIDKQFLLHEGGTKFYQVLRVKFTAGLPGGLSPTGSAMPSSGVVTVTHWGKHTGTPGVRRIVAGGEKQIKTGDSFQSVIKAKKGRGYEDTEIEWGTTNVLKDLASLDTYLTEELGATDAAEVKRGLGLSHAGAARFDEHDDAEPAPTSDPDDTPAARAARKVGTTAAAADLPGWGDF